MRARRQPPALIARHWLDGQRPDAATPWLLAAGHEALRLGAFTDALDHAEAVLAHEPRHVDALCLSAEALDALGRGGAPAAYAAAAKAVVVGADDLRAKQALAQLKLGDFDGAPCVRCAVNPTALDGRLAQSLTLSGVAAIGLTDPEAAAEHAAESRRVALELGDPGAVVAASWAQALAAHARGQLRESLRIDVRETSSMPDLAISVFDGQLCVTQRLLYGAAPYAEVVVYAESLLGGGAASGRESRTRIRTHTSRRGADCSPAASTKRSTTCPRPASSTDRCLPQRVRRTPCSDERRPRCMQEGPPKPIGC